MSITWLFMSLFTELSTKNRTMVNYVYVMPNILKVFKLDYKS